ncbi:hypothetical protein JCM8097_009333 [Rhodosporidiobolus ruineniae]
MDDLVPLEIVDLVAALHLSDLAELNQASKGKRREGDLSAEQQAFELYAAELREAEQVAADRRLALSLETATREDREALDAAEEEEEQARRDRQLALAVSRGRSTTASVVSTRSTSRQPSRTSTRASSSTRPTTASSPSSSSAALPHASSSKPSFLDCTICTERTPSHCVVHVPCKDQHPYCRDCLRDLFLAAAKDESLFPPRCDGTPIPLSLIRSHLSSTELALFERKSVEFTTTHRLYCSSPACSAFLGAATPSSKPAAVECEDCARETCRACKNPWHGEHGLCGAGDDDEAAAVLSRERGFQRCPGTCFCSRQFCYLCAAPWRTCTCPQWDEDRLLEVAQNRVRVEEEARPAYAPPPAVPRANRVAEAVEQLRVNHECQHRRWAYRSGDGQCESCFHYLNRFLLRCTECQMLACVRCKRNRL